MPSETLVLDRVFRALSNPTRREVVARLGKGPAAMTDLAKPFDMALPSFLQHLQVLEDSGLVSSKKTGRVRVFQLEPEPFLEAESWMDRRRREWKSRLDQLDRLLRQMKEEQQ